jgi:hypothetical protein
MTKRTNDQLIAELQDKLSRAKLKKHKDETRGKIIVGALMIGMLEKTGSVSRVTVIKAVDAITQPRDRRVAQLVIARMRNLESQQPASSSAPAANPSGGRSAQALAPVGEQKVAAGGPNSSAASAPGAHSLGSPAPSGQRTAQVASHESAASGSGSPVQPKTL